MTMTMTTWSWDELTPCIPAAAPAPATIPAAVPPDTPGVPPETPTVPPETPTVRMPPDTPAAVARIPAGTRSAWSWPSPPVPRPSARRRHCRIAGIPLLPGHKSRHHCAPPVGPAGRIPPRGARYIRDGGNFTRKVHGCPARNRRRAGKTLTAVPAEQMVEAARRYNRLARETQRHRSQAEVMRFFDGLELLEPGLVPVQRWRPECEVEAQAHSAMWGGVGRKPPG